MPAAIGISLASQPTDFTTLAGDDRDALPDDGDFSVTARRLTPHRRFEIITIVMFCQRKIRRRRERGFRRRRQVDVKPGHRFDN